MNIIHITVIALLVYESILDMRFGKVNIIPMIAVGVAGVLLNILMYGHTIVWLAKGLVTGSIVLAFGIISRQKIGYGDGFLFVMLGPCIGAASCLWLIWISMLAAGIAGIVLILRKKAGFKVAVPYLPFITIGFVIVALLGL